MSRRVILARWVLMARRTYLVTRLFQLQRMGIVAISAANTFVVHLALQERTVDINLILDLPIGMVQHRIKIRWRKEITVGVTWLKPLGDDTTATVAGRTRFDLLG